MLHVERKSDVAINTWWASLALRTVPFLVFAGLLAAGWRAWDIFHAVPSYEDVLEVIWSVAWYNGALAGMHGAATYPLVFFPTGWQVATFGEGPAIFLLLLPLSWLGGLAFAHNVGLWLTFLIAFLGARRLASRFLTALPATVAALLFTFWGFRWFRYIGHMNVLLAAAFLPWMVLSFDNALRIRAGRYRRLALTGLFWALMMACSWYFAFMGGILLAGWLLGRLVSRQVSWRTGLIGLVCAACVALALTAPLLLWFMKATNAANASFWKVQEINQWNASLNSLPAYSPDHPWLQPLNHWIYRGPEDESGRANFGPLALLLALAAVVPAWRRPRWRPILFITAFGLVLTLGLVLTWNGEPVQWAAMQPLNSAIWQIGHHFKPDVFPSAVPPPPFAAAVPLPALLLSAFVPLWERTRVFARYALLASTGLYLLSGLALMRVRWPWARLVIACLLLVELLPAPTRNLPFPLQPHPAFDWLAQQSLPPGESYVDLGPWQPSRMEVLIAGIVLWETEFDRQPTVAGASSVWPAHFAFLNTWLNTHPHAFQNPEFAPLLRFYQIHAIIYHVTNDDARDMLAEARRNPDLHDMRCFDPPQGVSPWNYPICVIQVAAGPANFNLLPREGWSGAESWGRWIEGTSARAEWVATVPGPRHVTLEAFPACVPGRRQTLRVMANGVEVARHQWDGCEPWSAQIEVPASAVRTGWNAVSLLADYAVRPVDVPSMQNSDSRNLSLGVTKLDVDY
jgi:hypothetical protein